MMKSKSLTALLIASLGEIPPHEFKSLLQGAKYSVQQTFEWYQNYVKYRKPLCKFLAIQDTKTKAYIGFMPLQVKSLRGTRLWNHRRWLPLADGPSDFSDFLCLPGSEKEVANAVADWFSRHGKQWDYLEFNLIPESSRSWNAFYEAFKSRGHLTVVDVPQKFYKIDTTSSWEDYEAKFLHKKLADVRNRRNRLKRQGIELHVKHIYSGIQDYLPKFFELYDARREKLSQKASFTTLEMKCFLKDIINQYEKSRGVRLSILQDQNNNAWAYQLDWLYQNISYHYIPAFDERFSDFSPGKILLYETIKSSFQDPEIVEFNFMRGESPYKRQFTDVSEKFISLKFINMNSLRLRATAFASTITNFRDKFIGSRS